MIWLEGMIGSFVLMLGLLGMAVRLYVGAHGWWFGRDEPESLILAQSERWRHA